jgi:integrase
LKRQSGLNENPFDLIKRKTLKTESKKEFTSEQLIKVFQSVDKKYPFSIPHRENVKILFRVGTYTGMRLKDCCLLETSKINLEKNTIAVKK